MMDIILINSSGKLLFFIFTMIPILFYLIWRVGFNLGKVKILMPLSNIIALYFYFSMSDLLIFFDQSSNNIIGTLIFFNLLFFSSIFTIIILTIPSHQNTNESTQNFIKKEEIYDSTALSDWNVKENLELSTSMELNSYNEEIITEDNPEIYKEVLNTEYTNNDFQKLINDLLKNQKIQ